MMEIIKLEESGYQSALYGLSLSFKEERISQKEWWTLERFDRMKHLAQKQALMDGGHNKFLESIVTWWSIKAPRGWWSEYDTYRLETKNSASTMHTLQRYELTEEDFEPGTDIIIINRFNALLRTETNDFKNKGRLDREALQRIKWNIPEGFLQTRQCRVSYKTLRNMILQRRTHRLVQWQQFLTFVIENVEHPELLPLLNKTE